MPESSPPTAREVVLAFIDALARSAPVEEIGAWIADDIVSEELPNRLFAQGAVRDRAAMLAGAVRGRFVVPDQRYTVERVICEGDEVAVAFTWEGTLAVDGAPIPRGTALRARCLGVFRVQHGRIVAHRSYDCYEPW